uniref:Tripartite motif-containing protein 2-like n=1 Tax=Crassostrea virginica TaxID=6565 RepID=A0A8B8BR41_CRAVI|nr:tripartite motif-containing protein 2-like [Crassostrea virginica]
MQVAGVALFLHNRPMLEIPYILSDISTGFSKLYGVSYFDNETICTRGDACIIKMFNLQGSLMESIKIPSGNFPQDIAFKKNGDLLYIDRRDRSVNIVRNAQIQTLIRPPGPRQPHNMCTTSADELLVMMDSNNGEETKLVRYSPAFTEIQNMTTDDRGRPLFSSGMYTRLLTENRNLEICVADWFARAVIVVSAAGELRFRYTGFPGDFGEQFRPFDVTTDSQSKILTTDHQNHCIHILDQDGNFLRYIDNCDLHDPRGLCVDCADNLLVAERNTGKVKRIKYYDEILH